MSLIAEPETDSNRVIKSHLPQSQANFLGLVTVIRSLLFLLTRLAFGLLCLVTSVYCLLLYIPFSYFGFIHNPILWWLPEFVRVHAYLYAVAFAAVAITLIPDLRKAGTRASAGAFLIVNAAACFYLLFVSSLGALKPDIGAYTWSIFGLFPVVWLGALDAVSAREEGKFAPEIRKTGNVASLALTAVAVASGFAVVSWLRDFANQGQHLSGKTRLLGIAVSFGVHIGLFVIAGGAWLIAQQISARVRWPERVYFVISRTLAWILCSAAVLKIALPTLSFTGWLAVVVSGAVGLAIVAGFEGSRAKLMSHLRLAEYSGRTSTSVRIAAGAVLVISAYAIPAVLAKTDWDFVLQRFAVLILWTLAFLCWGTVNISGAKKLVTSWLAIAVTLATVIGFHELNSASPAGNSWNRVIDSYAGSDISFKTAADILSRCLDNGSRETFFQFLRQHSNISAEISAQPSAVAMVANLAPGNGIKPNIFIFVIDSLRQDYVPYYAGSANFTPKIASFADESIEFKKAFTRYAGTALSEPAIWVGALQAHKQYIQPFYPMNNLAELLQKDGYDSYVSVDPILDLILPPSFPAHRLDAQNKHWGELDLIPTLAEIEHDIDTRADKTKPMFVYTQPQNVHTVTLEQTQHGSTRREMSVYELRRIDKAFGEFIGLLKSRGMYDNSIIVLTSDHGDSYGEFGRYGHSDFLFPEVIRIPLIIHVPPEVRRKMVYDSDEIAFSMDVVPTLYYLLGHRPISNHEWLGRPLITETQAEGRKYLRQDYLLASSYAPVYGILSEDGNSLFIADAVNRRSYFFDFAQDPLGTRNQTNARRWNEGEREIRRQLLVLDQVYDIHFTK